MQCGERAAMVIARLYDLDDAAIEHRGVESVKEVEREVGVHLVSRPGAPSQIFSQSAEN